MKAISLVLLTTLIYASTFLVVQRTTGTLPVFSFLFLRFAIAAVVFVPLIWDARRFKATLRSSGLWVVLAGLLFSGGFIFQTLGLRLITTGRSGFLTSLYVVFVPLLSWLVQRRAPGVRLSVAATLAFGGIALLSYSPGSNALGDLFALLSPLCFAGHIIAVGHFGQEDDWKVLTFLQLGIVAITTGMGALFQGFPFEAVTWSNGAAIAYTALLATALALGIQVWAQRVLESSTIALIFALEAPFVAIIGATVNAEVMSLSELMGCALCFGGTLVACANFRFSR